MVTDAQIGVALEAFDQKAGYSKIEKMRAALEADLSAAEPSVVVKALTLDALKKYFASLNDGDIGWSEMPTALYTYLLMDGYIAKDAARQEIRSALTAQVQDVAGAVEAFDKAHPELYWHIAKGKVTAGEPLYGAIITDLRGTKLGHGESDVSAIDAFNIAMLAAAPAKQEV